MPLDPDDDKDEDKPPHRPPTFQAPPPRPFVDEHDNGVGSDHREDRFNPSCSSSQPQLHRRARASSPAVAETSPSYSQSEYLNTSTPYNASYSRGPEIRYRLQRMHSLYPDVVTAELLRSMTHAMDRGSLTDLRDNLTLRVAEVRRDIATIHERAARAAQDDGSRGASRSSFGGGSSSGGGGGGGTW